MQTLVAAKFRGMNGGDERHVKNVLEPPPGVGHEPVVGVDEVKAPPEGEAHPLLQYGQVQLVHPGKKVQRATVVRPDAVDDDALVFLRRGQVFFHGRHHFHFIPLAHQGAREFADHVGHPPNHAGRVLPAKH